MRKANKNADSIIVIERLKASSVKMIEELLKEQRGFCAYTDEYISRTDAVDVEHFNPKLKNTDGDSYENWYAVKHKWNSEKSNKWDKFQPVLHPTASDFELRVIYVDGDYFAASDEDVEAVNVVKLLKLDDLALADKRKKYIKRKAKEIAVHKEGAEAYFQSLVGDDICQVSYLRAIKEEFNVDLWKIIH